jgi:hypothetical protein
VARIRRLPADRSAPPVPARGIPGPGILSGGVLLLAASLLFPPPSHAVRFPDTTDLKKDYRLAARKDGRPAAFFRKAEGDSASLHLEWSGGSVSSVRIEQSGEFEPDTFAVLTSEYGEGAAWHESMESAGLEEARSMYPGLQQEWILKGYGGQKGWLGSGVFRGRYFLVFRASAPKEKAAVPGPLRLNPAVSAILDTSSQWLHVACGGAGSGKRGEGKAEASGKDAACFSPSDDSRMRVRIDRKKNLSVQAWLAEGESGALGDIRKAMESIPDAAQADYAEDLSQMLSGEARMFLVKLSQRLPELFNWPSWQIQDFKAGRIPSSEYLPLVRAQINPGDSLPAFRFEDEGITLVVWLYYKGTLHMSAEERTPRRSQGGQVPSKPGAGPEKQNRSHP